jgi:RNA-directed DNA polymerase
MKKLNKVWGDIDWARAEKIVFKLQCKIYFAFKNGNDADGVRLQKRLLKSRHAKCLAVHLAAEVSNGRHSAGPDGVCSGERTAKKGKGKLKKLTVSMLKNMADDLSLQHSPSPVKRIEIDKLGSTEKRGIGIPNIEDRAHQALINIALLPEWEAKFFPQQVGFRKGRWQHDAITYVRRSIQAAPKFVLDCDIEKFFDRIDHEALMRAIGTFPEMEKAIRRIIKTGAIYKGVFIPGEKGTPQGGVISPLLANIVMSGLAAYMRDAFKKQRRTIGAKSYKAPYLSVYADDLVVMHDELVVIEWAQGVVSEYIAGFGLNLSLKKTRICHTMNKCGDEAPGFNYLGVNIRQFAVGKYSPAPYGKNVATVIKPSEEAKKRFRHKVSEIIKGNKLSRKKREARRHKTRRGQTDPVTVMINKLNRYTTGWANYYRYHNSKETFSSLDNYIYQRLRAWAIRQFPGKKIEWVNDRMFSGVELDRKGQPLRRLDGELRERKWAFNSPFICKEKPHKTVKKVADTPIKRHMLVRGEKSVFDRDWAYWATRQGRYPLLPQSIAKLMKEQGRKCYACKVIINTGDRLSIVSMQREPPRKRVLTHEACKGTHPSLSKGLYV